MKTPLPGAPAFRAPSQAGGRNLRQNAASEEVLASRPRREGKRRRRRLSQVSV